MNIKNYDSLNRGVPVTIPVIVKTVEDTPINLSGLKIYFTVKSAKYDFDRDDRFAIIKKEFEAQNPVNGGFEIQLTARDMDFEPGQYYFDVVIGGWRALNMPFELIGGPTNRIVSETNRLSHLNRTITILKQEPTPLIVLSNFDPFLTNLQQQLKEEIVSELTVSDFKTVEEYLHEVWYTNVDYDLGRQHLKKSSSFKPVGLCSSFKYGNYFGRNFDWYFSEAPTFVCHIPRIGRRYASLNVSNCPGKLTESMIKSGEYKRYLSLLPFYTRDGINEFGVVCNDNVVPRDDFDGPSIPKVEVRETINGAMLNRYILDNFVGAREAASYIKSYVSIEMPKDLLDMGYNLHWLISSGDKTYVLEVINGKNEIEELVEGRAAMTNFNRTPVLFNADKTLYTPETKQAGEKLTKIHNLDPLACGLERYNHLITNLTTVDSIAAARKLLGDIYYTRFYPSSPRPSDVHWNTECVGAGELTIDSEPEDFLPAFKIVAEQYSKRDRSKIETWQTIHSSVYDFQNKTLNLVVQEENKEFKFSL